MGGAHPPPEPTIIRAIVLAAGIGSRLGPHSGTVPKPLVPLGGRAIIAYTLDALAQAGVPEAIVVTGHEEARLRAGLADGAPLPLRFVSNPRFARGASLSLAAARHLAADEPFLLTMSDHIIDAAVVHTLLALGLTRGAAVAADFAPDPHHDIAEATKLALSPVLPPEGPSQGGDSRPSQARSALPAAGAGLPRVCAIGKHLPSWDALDAGAFFCTPDVWRALDDGPEDRDLSSVFATMIASGSFVAADIDGGFWFDIDTPADLATAETLIRERASNPASHIPSI